MRKLARKLISFLPLLFVLCTPAQAQITYFGSASTPADPGTQVGPGPVAITPPTSMTTGDLVLVVCQYRDNATPAQPFSVSEAGGQSWTAEAAFANGTFVTGQLFWARFNGTWGANPSFQIDTGALAFTAVMHVFRPTDTGKVWSVDVAQVDTDFAAPSTPFTVTITGVTTVAASTVTFAAWNTADDNTWGNIAGTGWVVTGSEQYRNTTGSDQSSTYAHKIQTSAGATGNVSKDQLTLGGDLGNDIIIAFAEADAGAAVPGFNKRKKLEKYGLPPSGK